MEKIKKEIKGLNVSVTVFACMAIAALIGFLVSLIEGNILPTSAFGISAIINIIFSAVNSLKIDILQLKLDEKEKKAEALETEEFYILMQDYRNTPYSNQDLVVSNYNEVKNWIRKNL